MLVLDFTPTTLESAITMIRSGKSVRFIPKEIESCREAGIDVTGVKTQADLDNAVEHWAHAMSEDRPDLLEKIAAEMASRKGEKLPPKLAVVTPSDDSPQRS